MTTITLPRAVVEQALEALEAIREADTAGATPKMVVKARSMYEPAVTALRAALAQGRANPPGCDHCNHPLYAATKCRVCGRVTEPKEQAEPVEPVAWIYQNMYTEQEYLVWKKGTGGRNWRPLYTAPPKAEPLTEEEIDSPERRCGGPGCDLKCCQPVQEPVAWLWKIKAVDEGPHTQQLYFFSGDDKPWSNGWTWKPLYTAPPQRKPLTTEQILDLFDAHNVYGIKWVEFARAVERAHGIGDNK